MNEKELLKKILKKLRPRNIFEDFLDKGNIMTARYIFNGADLREAIKLATEYAQDNEKEKKGCGNRLDYPDINCGEFFMGETRYCDECMKVNKEKLLYFKEAGIILPKKRTDEITKEVREVRKNTQDNSHENHSQEDGSGAEIIKAKEDTVDSTLPLDCQVNLHERDRELERANDSLNPDANSPRKSPVYAGRPAPKEPLVGDANTNKEVKKQ